MATNFPIEDVVDAIIAIGDQPVSTRDFGAACVFGAHNIFSERTRTYSDTASLISDGFSSGSNIYKMVNAMLAGPFKPTSVIVGRRDLTTYVSSFTVANNTVYTIGVSVNTGASIFHKTYSYTSDSDATAAEIASALQVLIEADADINAFVSASVATDTLVVSPTSGGLVSVGGITTNIATTETSGESATVGITAVEADNPQFFFLTSDAHDDTATTELAAWSESNKRLYVTSNQSSDIWTSSTSDILSTLGNASYNNTMLIALETADIEFPEAAMVGAWAGTQPGSSSPNAKILTGVTPTSLSRTEVDFINNKNGNAYVLRGGLGYLQFGRMVSGRFASVTRGSLWLEARLEEAVFAEISRLSNSGLKIPYTDSGVAIITSIMGGVLDEAVQVAFLSGYTITPPRVADISDNDKANGLLPDVPFSATLAGEIIQVVIRGYLSF